MLCAGFLIAAFAILCITGQSSTISSSLTGESTTDSIKYCEYLGKYIRNGKYTGGTNKLGGVFFVECDVGYYPSENTVICQENGEWTQAECLIKDCGSQLPDIAFGSVTLVDRTTYKSTAMIKCDPGYESGGNSITCQSSGIWETPSDCYPKDCGPLAEIKNGILRLNSNATTYQSKSSVICDPGYTSDVTIITCQFDGKWSTTECTSIDCGVFPVIRHGSIRLIHKDTTFSSKAVITCMTGYEADPYYIECQADGTWTFTECVKKDCGPVPLIENGALILRSNTTTYGSDAFVRCAAGYSSGKAFITCLPDGTWEDILCKTRNCRQPPAIANGTVRLASATTLYGSKAIVTCANGYTPEKRIIYCQASGLWEDAICYKGGSDKLRPDLCVTVAVLVYIIVIFNIS